MLYFNKSNIKKLKETEITEAIKNKQGAAWINISSASSENINLLRETFKIHPTTIEDIFSEQTPFKKWCNPSFKRDTQMTQAIAAISLILLVLLLPVYLIVLFINLYFRCFMLL